MPQIFWVIVTIIAATAAVMISDYVPPQYSYWLLSLGILLSGFALGISASQVYRSWVSIRVKR